MATPIPPQLTGQLRAARHVLVLSGAGVSAESGVPTFRDAQTGLWQHHSAEELATPEAFARNPELVWNWYAWRRELATRAEPNPGHVALAQLATLVARLTLVTQNVDGLHQRAGSREVIEFHGNLLRDRCSAACGVVADATPESPSASPPPCPRCGAHLRPDVVWFGETIPATALRAAGAAAEDCDLLISVGTSSLVYPAAALAEIALRAGAVVVEINPAPTPLSTLAEHVLRGTAGEVLPALVVSLRGGSNAAG